MNGCKDKCNGCSNICFGCQSTCIGACKGRNNAGVDCSGCLSSCRGGCVDSSCSATGREFIYLLNNTQKKEALNNENFLFYFNM